MALSKKTKLKIGLIIILLVSAVLAIMAWPREDIALKQIGIDTPLKVRRGLDLQGGVYLVYEADTSQLEASANTAEVVENAAAVIERRVNPGGTSEVVVQTAANNRIVVQLPGIENPEEAVQSIGRTAQLAFYEVSQSEGSAGLLPTEVSGQDIARANVDFEPTTGKPIISLQLKGGESTQKFADLTTRLSQNGNMLVTLLDQQVVFGPASVAQPLTDGQAQLSGDFTPKEAEEIATLLNAGALPVPINLVAQQTIGPTLGALSVKQSVVAAGLGLISVALFLIINYRIAGAMAVGSLVFYALAMLTLFKLSVFTPYVIVLTLAGIAGFILSIAVAADANILILERVKEELRGGASALRSLQLGFDHAWTSIKDANIATLLICVILFYSGNYFGVTIIQSFAKALGIGVLLSLFTTYVITKNFLNVLVRSRLIDGRSWLGASTKGETL